MTPHRFTVRLLSLALFAAVAAPSPGFAQGTPRDLSQASIEDLMNIEITSASRKEQRAADVAAAVFVITSEDIRRSGMTTLPDLIRLAPGVEVAQINSNKWAVSVRGFNGLYANKLLVLVDGRSVYNKIFSGVFWDAEDPMLDDIDRIEVIRGPGAALWGANAVNGVVNIVTKSAADTVGALVRVDGGQSGEQAAVRYGATHGAASYRVYSQWTRRDQSLAAPDTRADDASYRSTTGFRADWTTPPGAFLVQGDFTTGEAHALWPNLDPLTSALAPIVNEPSVAHGGHVLGRWTHTRPGGASLQVQSFVDVASRQEPVGDYRRHTLDVDSQYHSRIGTHQDLVAGSSYRYISENFAGHVGFSLTPAHSTSSLVGAFLQDEIALLNNRLAITLGSQVQYESDSGAGIQPTARVMWKGLPRQRLWAATSRALRTPSLADRGIRVDYPPAPSASGLPLFVVALGNPASKTETFVDTEAGYRIEIGSSTSLDVTGFAGRYEHLRTIESDPPVVRFVPAPQILVTTTFGNQLEATTMGLEVAGHWAPNPVWRFDGSYTAFHVAPTLSAISQDPAAAAEDASAPSAEWLVRTAFSPGDRATLNVAIFHVGPLDQSAVPAYTRADVSAEWRFTSRLSIMATGQNLLDAWHIESAGAASLLRSTLVPRAANLRLRWMF